VVAIGAGFAGLAAADVLAASHSVRVLEARDRVGGRALNHDLGDGKVVEIGGQWVGPQQRHIGELAQRVGVTTHPTYDKGKAVFGLGGRRLTYRRVPRLPL